MIHDNGLNSKIVTDTRWHTQKNSLEINPSNFLCGIQSSVFNTDQIIEAQKENAEKGQQMQRQKGAIVSNSYCELYILANHRDGLHVLSFQERKRGVIRVQAQELSMFKKEEGKTKQNKL